METVAAPVAPDLDGPNGVSPSAVGAIDPTIIVKHLVSAVEITLGATREDLERPGNLLSTANHADTIERCTRFASESQCALYVQKGLAQSAEEVNGSGESRKSLQRRF